MKEGARRRADEAVWRERGWDRRVCVLWRTRRKKGGVREWKDTEKGDRLRKGKDIVREG
jgi:hypothetical protein